MTPQATPVIPVSELAIIVALVLFFAIWGWRHGLDAVILAGLFVLFGRISIDTLAVAASAIINMFYGIFDLLGTGKFGPETLIGVIRANPDVVKPLINLSNPQDAWLKLVGTALFAMIAYIGFKFAVKKAGGKDTPIEQVFGFVGGGALGYLCLTFVIERHITFPQQIEIQRSTVPQINVDAPLLVAIIIVLIVFGIQRSKAPAKKK
jgi:hypothetical protein